MTTQEVLESLAAADEATLLHAMTNADRTPLGFAIMLAATGEMLCRSAGPDTPHPDSGVSYHECRQQAAEAVAAHPLADVEWRLTVVSPTDDELLRDMAQARAEMSGTVEPAPQTFQGPDHGPVVSPERPHEPKDDLPR